MQFTAGMELKLDEIEEQHLDWIKLLKDFYGPFHETVDGALDKLEHAGGTPSPYTCEKCGSPMVYRISKNGFFLSCSNYPECDGIKAVDKQGKPKMQEKSEYQMPQLRPRDAQDERPVRRIPRLQRIHDQKAGRHARMRNDHQPGQGRQADAAQAQGDDAGQMRKMRQPDDPARQQARAVSGMQRISQMPGDQAGRQDDRRGSENRRGPDPQAEGRRRQGRGDGGRSSPASPRPPTTATPARSPPTSTATNAASRW